MKNLFKRVFYTKYRIYPVYDTHIMGKPCGYVVYERAWYAPIYFGSTLDVITENGLSNKGEAVFKTKMEAVDFIKSRTTNYNYETIQAI